MGEQIRAVAFIRQRRPAEHLAQRGHVSRAGIANRYGCHAGSLLLRGATGKRFIDRVRRRSQVRKNARSVSSSGVAMPHIELKSAEPGIRGLLRYRPETGRPLSELAEVLLRGPSTLTRGERELIAAHVSALNDCRYCSSAHSACAAAQLPGGMALVEQVRTDLGAAPVPDKLKALLDMAAAVRDSGHVKLKALLD